MTEIDSVRTDYALTFLTDTARDSDINPDQISKCHGLVADELTRLREENARLRDALEGLAAGQCCETPSCNTDDPKCDTMIARQALKVPS